MPANPIDLTDSTQVDNWITESNVNLSTIIQTFITNQSRYIRSSIARNLVFGVYTETRNGNGRRAMSVKNWPLLQLLNLTINGVVISPSPTPTGTGFLTNQEAVMLVGYPPAQGSNSFYFGPLAFYRGYANTVLQYTAGYLTVGQQDLFTAHSDWQVSTSYSWAAIIQPTVNNPGNFIFWDSTPNTQTSGGTEPTSWNQGLGSVTQDANIAWLNTGLTILPELVPFDLQEACTELVALRLRERQRTGEMSKTLGTGMVISFLRDPEQAMVKRVLDRYQEVWVEPELY